MFPALWMSATRLTSINFGGHGLASKGEVEFADPRGVVELDFHFPKVTFRHPGEYRFQLLAKGNLLMERRMLVHSGPADAPIDRE